MTFLKQFPTTLLAMACLGLAAAPAANAAAHAPAKSAKAPKKPAIDYSGEFVNFGQWKDVQQFMGDLEQKHGIPLAESEKLFLELRYIDAAVQLVKPAPPGKPKNWQAYSARFIEPKRIRAGIDFWNANRDALARAEALYGVPAEIIVGIIGVETLYGRDMGKFRVLDVLATLAFSYPPTPNREVRMAFFRSELEAAIVSSRQAGLDPLALTGSYAGAVGLPQFMPGNIYTLGVDFDNDGKVDLRNSPSDAIGSVANFLVAHGWKRDDPAPLAYPATMSPERAWEKYLNGGLDPKYRGEELLAAGVHPATDLPPGMYGLVDLQNGSEATEYWVGSNNFFSITKYNRSYFYAMSVVELGKAIKLSMKETM
ncbi:lytic murein transglycosylase B [Pseudoduganella violaceinigra]|uniref:lytic murein transglycosylase B n=1 Tax=Pseudoduganella violaceinigra TaxID=246602 RepID=UPI0003FF4013|nr:lytic murein transglycosylase B [Pseudoduganella violaceinigra]